MVLKVRTVIILGRASIQKWVWESSEGTGHIIFLHGGYDNINVFSLCRFTELTLKICVLSCVYIVLTLCSVTQSCPSFCDPTPARLLCPWYFAGKILEWVAISYSRGSSPPRDWICVSCLAGGFFTTVPPGKPICILYLNKIIL